MFIGVALMANWDARLTKRMRTLGLVECEVEDERGSLVAKTETSSPVRP